MRTAILVLALAPLLPAQDLTHKAPPQTEAIAIVNATVHPVSGPAIQNGYVLFEKGRITRVGQGDVAAARKIDAKGKHVYPGLIASHTRLGLAEIGAVRAMRDFDEVGDITPEVRAAVAVNPDSALLPVTRSNGVLTFATYPSGGVIPGRASVMTMDGWTWEQMSVRADAGMVVNWPNPRPRRGRARRADEDERQRNIQKRMETVREAFARARAYLAAKKADPDTPTDIRWEAMRGVLEGGLPVFFQADDYDQIVSAVHFAAEQRLNAVILGGRDTHLCVDLLKRHDVAVIIASLHAFPKRSDSDYDETYKLPAKLEKAGIRWCLASGERTANVRNLPYAAGRAVAYGLSREAALRCITLQAARVLGVAKELGSLEPGKRATLIVTNGDPLEVPTRIERAFIDGREIDLTNKQTKLAAKYRAKYSKG